MYRLCRIRLSITRSGGIIFYLLFCSIIKFKKKNESERERNTKVGLEVGGVGATLESGVSDRNTTEEKDIVYEQFINTLENNTRIERGSWNKFPYSSTQQHYLSIAVFLHRHIDRVCPTQTSIKAELYLYSHSVSFSVLLDAEFEIVTASESSLISDPPRRGEVREEGEVLPAALQEERLLLVTGPHTGQAPDPPHFSISKDGIFQPRGLAEKMFGVGRQEYSGQDLTKVSPGAQPFSQ